MSSPTGAASAVRPGIDRASLREMAKHGQEGSCPAVRHRMATLVEASLSAARQLGVELVEQAAASRAHGDHGSGRLPTSAQVHAWLVEVLELQDRQQVVLQLLSTPSTADACDASCPGDTAVAASDVAVAAGTTPRYPLARKAVSDTSSDTSSSPPIVCTISGGASAMSQRVAQWQDVIDRATGREPADAGVTLTFGLDPDVAVELARLGAAEHACCLFFTFTLSIGGHGMRFTVTAPPEARHVVAAMFGVSVDDPSAP